MPEQRENEAESAVYSHSLRCPEPDPAAGAAGTNTGIEDYLDHVCAPLVGLVPYVRRQELRAELRGHLEALTASYRELESAPEVAAEQALRQFGDPRELARRCADEWRRGAPSRTSQPAWPAVLVALGCFSVLEPLYGVLAGTLGARGYSPGDWWIIVPAVLLTLLAGLTTGLATPYRPVRGTLLALALLPLPSLAMLFIEMVHSAVTIGHGVQLWAATQTVRFVAGAWLQEYHFMLLPGCAGAPLACAGAALGGRLRARLALKPGRRVLQ